MGESLTPEQLRRALDTLLALRTIWQAMIVTRGSDPLSARWAQAMQGAEDECIALIASTLRTVEQERDAWHRRWLDETATSEQFERERDDARAALRLMQEAR